MNTFLQQHTAWDPWGQTQSETLVFFLFFFCFVFFTSSLKQQQLAVFVHTLYTQKKLARGVCEMFGRKEYELWLFHSSADTIDNKWHRLYV